MNIKQAETKEDFLNCWEAVRALHPTLHQDRYLTLMLYMIDEGYKLIFIEEEGKAVSVCGYRVITMLARGRSIYIDDLSTLPEWRGKGYASALMAHVRKWAIEEELESIHLDLGPKAHEAHKLVIGSDYRLNGQHFSVRIHS